MGNKYRCCICQEKVIHSANHWLCPQCAAAYDLDRPYAEWPEWAKAAAEFERELRRIDKDLDNTDSFEDLPEGARVTKLSL